MGSEAARGRTDHAGTHRSASVRQVGHFAKEFKKNMERHMLHAVASIAGRGLISNRLPERRGGLPRFTLVVERAPEGARRCGKCASVGTRIACDPPTRIGRDWTQCRPGLDVVVGLRPYKGAVRPVLRALVQLEADGEVHAQVVYLSEPLDPDYPSGPWLLHKRSEDADCGFAFPEQVEIVADCPLPPQCFEVAPLANKIVRK